MEIYNVILFIINILCSKFILVPHFIFFCCINKTQIVLCNNFNISLLVYIM